MREPRSIAITGASSGIGRALASVYAAPGVTLALAGRDETRLAAAAETCRVRGATVETRCLDVRAAAAVASWLADHHAAAPLDLVIANAGISAGTGGGGEGAEQTRRIFAVNLDGVLNTVLPAVELMAEKAPRNGVRGQIAIVSSLASFRGFPGAPAYSASKAAARVYAEALRGALRGEGIEVSAICPGFVKSAMTAVNEFRMPFLMETEEAARRIRRGLEDNRGRIAFPLPLYVAVRLIGALPIALTDRWLARLPKKAREPRPGDRRAV